MDDMLKAFSAYVQRATLFNPLEDKILLAVSGGVDSMVMAYLFRQAGYRFGIAHCNFGLRGAESDGDAALVREQAAVWGVPYMEQQFDTVHFAQTQQLSIQLAARQLRYSCLEEWRREGGYAYIATAHHLDDSIETMFMNVLKGCGIHGLQGIRPRNEAGRLIRPLGFATKSALRAYSMEQAIAYREDSSNATDKYFRNQLRHHLVPVLERHQPQLASVFADNFRRWEAAEWLYDWAVAAWKKQLLDESTAGAAVRHIDIRLLEGIPVAVTLLWEIAQPYGFRAEQIEQLWENSQPGAWIDSPHYRILRDRNRWVISPLKEWEQAAAGVVALSVEGDEGRWAGAHPTLVYRIYPKTADKQNVTDSRCICLDADAVGKALRLRIWRAGDRFKPVGMNGRSKKVSDYLKDKKLSLYEKSMVWVLETPQHIAWLVGLRLDETYKVTHKTQHVLEIQVQNEDKKEG